VANGHHSKFPYMKHYDWLIKQEYRNERRFSNDRFQRDCPEDQLGLGDTRDDD